MGATAWALASLGVLLLGFAVANSSALPHRTAPAGNASAPLCKGNAKRLRPAHVSFSFECGNEDVTAFKVQANRALHFLYDPNPRPQLRIDIPHSVHPEGAMLNRSS
jgi:hypothetical protein